MVEQNQEVYNKIAKHFSDTRSWVTDDLVLLGKYVHDNDSVLDLACGNGRLYQLFSEEKRESKIKYTGIDFSENLLAMAQKRFPNISVQVGDMRNIPCADSTFDVVFCLAAFHHLSSDIDRMTALKEIKRVLKPGGTFVMTNWNIYSDWAKEKLKSGKWWYGKNEKEIVVPWRDGSGSVIGERLYYAYTEEEIEKWCRDAGLKIKEQYIATKKGGSTDASEVGLNIVTIATRP
jgi:ubiquinone/menaquinone biosynthesis C-methylase UbiE